MTPPDPAPSGPPRFSPAREILGALRSLTRSEAPPVEPHPAPPPILVLPGFGTTDRWTVWLRGRLAAAGHPVRGWGLGRNTGDVKPLTERLLPTLDRWVEAHGPTALVGWSLGGTIARAVSRRRPAHVSHIVTLGTPVRGGPRYTFVAERTARRGVDLAALERRIAEQERAHPVPVPMTHLYTRADTVVAWEACLDPWNAARRVEVQTTHLGLVVDRTVVAEIRRALR